MILRMSVLSVAVVIVLGTAAPAKAQQGTYYRGSSDNPVGPTVSPYLNLIQNNQFGATNYQSLVKPLIEQGNAINRQGRNLNNLQQQVYSRPQGAGGFQSTGHATFFMNYSHYYPQQGR